MRRVRPGARGVCTGEGARSAAAGTHIDCCQVKRGYGPVPMQGTAASEAIARVVPEEEGVRDSARLRYAKRAHAPRCGSRDTCAGAAARRSRSSVAGEPATRRVADANAQRRSMRSRARWNGAARAFRARRFWNQPSVLCTLGAARLQVYCCHALRVRSVLGLFLFAILFGYLHDCFTFHLCTQR